MNSMLCVKHLTFRGDEQGFSLIELLVAVIITSIAFFGLAMPFIAERSLWGSGKRQSEAQRDAQMITRAIARVARESQSYTLGGSAGDRTLLFTRPDGTTICFRGGSTFNNGQLQRLEPLCTSSGSSLIDGVRSRVMDFTPTSINGKLARVQLQVAHQNLPSYANEPEKNEILKTDIFLRNNAT